MLVCWILTAREIAIVTQATIHHLALILYDGLCLLAITLGSPTPVAPGPVEILKQNFPEAGQLISHYSSSKKHKSLLLPNGCPLH